MADKIIISFRCWTFHWRRSFGLKPSWQQGGKKSKINQTKTKRTRTSSGKEDKVDKVGVSSVLIFGWFSSFCFVSLGWFPLPASVLCRSKWDQDCGARWGGELCWILDSRAQGQVFSLQDCFFFFQLSNFFFSIFLLQNLKRKRLEVFFFSKMDWLRSTYTTRRRWPKKSQQWWNSLIGSCGGPSLAWGEVISSNQYGFDCY